MGMFALKIQMHMANATAFSHFCPNDTQADQILLGCQHGMKCQTVAVVQADLMRRKPHFGSGGRNRLNHQIPHRRKQQEVIQKNKSSVNFREKPSCPQNSQQQKPNQKQRLPEIQPDSKKWTMAFWRLLGERKGFGKAACREEWGEQLLRLFLFEEWEENREGVLSTAISWAADMHRHQPEQLHHEILPDINIIDRTSSQLVAELGKESAVNGKGGGICIKAEFAVGEQIFQEGQEPESQNDNGNIDSHSGNTVKIADNLIREGTQQLLHLQFIQNIPADFSTL